MTLGVVIGKFYPFHLGHDLVISRAKEQVDQLVVLCCAKRTDMIPGEVRAVWIREEHPDVTVLDVADDLPEEPAPWARRTIELLDRSPDTVFTSESYGDDYAALMDARHVSVDPDRTIFPVSGTLLRSELAAHWELLTPAAKAGLARRICVTGVESSGTTTLTEDLASHFGTAFVPEYGRSYWEGRRFIPSAEQWSEDEFVRIATRQQDIEDDLARRANRILICDTDALTTNVWHRRYRGDYSQRVEEIADSRSYDLYLVTTPSFPFVQDGTREGEAIRHEMHGWLTDALTSSNRKWIEVDGSPGARVAQAVAAMEPLLRFESLS